MKVTKNKLLDTWEMAESSEEAVRQSSGLKPADGMRILIVDDDKHIRDLYSDILDASFPDCKIDMAADGEKAVQLFAQHHYGVVLLDYVMPHMNGEETFFKMLDLCDENAWERPAFLFCTGCNPPQSLRNAVASHPMYCLLHKPVSKRTLKDAVQSRLK